MRGKLLACALLGVSLSANSAVIEVDPVTLSASNIVDFEDLGIAVDTLVNYDGVLVSGMTSFSERFVGQTVVEVGVFDTLTGTPVDELTLANGPANQNLTAGNLGGNAGLSGESSVESLGEGSVAVLFDEDQSQVAFDVLGSDLDEFMMGGTVIASFYARNGILLNQFALTLDGSASKSFGFKTDDSAFVIAGITLTNNDNGGVGYDNFIYDVAATQSQVPVPAAVWLFVSALGLLGWLRRR